MLRNCLTLVAVASLLVSTGCDIEGFGNSEQYSQDFHYNYPLKPGGQLTVENFNGSVDISGWDQNNVDISGAKYGATPELRDAIKIDIQTSGNSIYVRTVRPSGRRGNMGARFVIKVPRETELGRIVSSNGSVNAADIAGEARLKTSNGSLSVMRLKGNLTAQTSNAGITVDDLEGVATLKTSNGRVRAERIRGAVDADTSNASVRVQIDKPDSGHTIRLDSSNGSIELTMGAFDQNEVHASTSNASITLHLPSNLSAQLKAVTSNSSVTSDFDVKTHGTTNKHHLEGTIGVSGPVLDLSTSNGSIHVLKL